jgi:F-box protein 9
MSREKDDEAVWFREDWELTWPIWHMLPHDERKSLASKYGYATIGEFEEDMTLRRAVGDSSEQQPYDNSLLYTHVEEEPKQETEREFSGAKKSAEVPDEQESEGEEPDELLECSASGDDLSETELMERAGTIMLLPEELIHRLLEWLPVDMYATLALVSPHWIYLTRTESVYKRLCERCYLNQSKRRSLNVSRFGYSYRTMLEKRPRVRAGGGLYALKYTSVRTIQRDMWTEVSLYFVLCIDNVSFETNTHAVFCA